MKKEVLISNQQLQAVFEQAAVGMVIVDAAQNRFVKVNRRFCEIVGYSAEELLQGSIHDITHPDDLRMDLNHVERISAGIARESSWEKRYRKKDGTVVWARVFVTPLDPSEAKPTLRLGVIEEITDRKRAEEALRWSEIQLHAILESTADGILAVDNKGKVIKANRRFADLWRIPQSLMDAGDDRALLDFVMNQLSDPDAFLKKVRLLYDSDTVDMDTLAFKDGRVFERFSFPMIMEGVVIGRVWSFRDITERKQMEEALRESENRYRELSIVDDLTQLYNSRHFYHQLKMEIDRADRYGQPLTLLLLDLDDFKAFNDTYGHVEGDQVLSRLGQVVKRCLRQTDSAYRYGGEEFTILLPMTTSADGAVTAERIRTEFKKETFSPVPGQDVHMTVSIGLAQYKPQEDMKAFVHRVDQLMYQGKKNGKDRVCSEL